MQSRPTALPLTQLTWQGQAFQMREVEAKAVGQVWAPLFATWSILSGSEFMHMLTKERKTTEEVPWPPRWSSALQLQSKHSNLKKSGFVQPSSF